MEYKVSQFAKRLGLTRETLRFYEQKNLISPKRIDGSRYRVYTDLDGLELLRMRSLQSWQLSLEEIAAKSDNYSLTAQDRLLTSLEINLGTEIRRLQQRLQRVQKQHDFVREALSDMGKITEFETHGIYKLMMLGKGVNLSDGQQKIANQWLRTMPVTDIGWEISIDDVKNAESDFVDTKIGLMLLPQYVEEYDLSIRPPVYFFPVGHSIRTMICTKNPFRVERSAFQPLLNYASGHNYKITSNISGRFSGSAVHDGYVDYYFSARFNVEKQ